MSMKKGSHKILKSVALAGALTATGAVTTTAHADTTKASAPVQGVASTDQQLTNLKSQQTANESAVASSNAATMSAATTSANSQIADLNNQIKERQASDAAVQQASQASAIAQVNSEAASATSAENASYSQAVASQTAANNVALKSAQATIVTEQQKNQETAQENTDFQKQTSNLDSQHKATLDKLDQDLQNDTNNTNDAIQKEVARQKADQQGAIDKTAKDFDNQIKDASQTVDQAQKVVNDDQSVISDKKRANDTAQQAVKNAQDKLSGSQEALKKLEDTNISQTVKINKDQWYQAYNDWYTTGGYKGGTITDTDVQNLVRMRYSDNQYQNNEQDANEMIDPNNLTENQLKEINIFGANILNQIREQLDIAPVKVTQGSINFVKSIADNYKNDNWDSSHGHYDKGIGKAAKQYGLLAGNYYECLGGNYYINTMDNLKAMVYNDILGMTLGSITQNGTGGGNLDGHGGSKIGIEFAHANGLLGYPHDNPSGYTEDFALDTNINEHNACILDHLITVPTDKKHSYYWTDPTKYDRTEIPLGQNDRQQLQAAVNTDTQALNNAKSKANTTAFDLKSAQDKLASDSAKLSQAQAHVNDLKANKDQTLKAMVTDPMQSPAVKKLQNKLTDIKQQHDTAVKAENDQYIAKVSDLKAKHEAKLAEIAAQPTSLAELQSQLQDKLDTLKTNHDVKLKQITDDANAKIAAIKSQKVNDPEIDKLNAQIDQIKSDLAKEQQELDNQYEALKTKDQAEYNTLANKLNPSTKAVANGSTQQVFTSRSGKVAYVVPSHQSIATSDIVKTVSEQVNSESLSKESQNNTNRLPQTGNKSSLAMVLLGTAAAMFGIGLVGKKKEY